MSAGDSFPNTSTRALYSAASVIGPTCKDANADFVRCKMDNADPKACVHFGEKVTACTLSVLRTLEQSCAESHTAGQECLQGPSMDFHRCKVEARAVKSCFDSARALEKEQALATPKE